MGSRMPKSIMGTARSRHPHAIVGGTTWNASQCDSKVFGLARGVSFSKPNNLNPQCFRFALFHQYPKMAAKNCNVPPAIVVQSLDAQSAEAGLIVIESAVDESGQDPKTRAHAHYKRLHPSDANPEESFSRLLEDSSLARVTQHLDDLHEAFQELKVGRDTCRPFWHALIRRETTVKLFVTFLDLDKQPDLKERFIHLAFFHQYPKLAAANLNVPLAIVVQSLNAQSAEAGLIVIESAVDESGQDPKTRAYALYKRLHPSDANPEDSFLRLLEDSSLARVTQHLDDLHEAFQEVKVGRDTCRLLWHMLICREISIKQFVMMLGLDKQPDLKERFIRLAFFHQYPKLVAENRNVPPAIVVQSLDAQSAEAGLVLMQPRVNQSPQGLEIIEEGYKSEYLRYDSIVEPLLRRLSKYAKDWTPTNYYAPYTSIIGASMTGKSRLHTKLSERICVIYICLRPLGVSGFPPRSALADLILPNQTTDLCEYYCRALAAIFQVVADFFNSQSTDRSEVERLEAWNEYASFESATTPFTSEVFKKMGTLPAASLSDSQNKLVVAVKNMQKSTEFIANPDLKVLLALDEARATLLLEEKPSQVSFFRRLRTALNNIPPSHNFFATVTDTSPAIAHFSPNAQDDPSNRPSTQSYNLYPPIYDIGTFDSMVPSQPPSTWEELESPARLFSYGWGVRAPLQETTPGRKSTPCLGAADLATPRATRDHMGAPDRLATGIPSRPALLEETLLTGPGQPPRGVMEGSAEKEAPVEQSVPRIPGKAEGISRREAECMRRY
ncbi:hypothetical protein PtB15_4B188 [Puccinia triticina]|nr:hypothetical protein PtB15_4B188 [Puccinia triticina]